MSLSEPAASFQLANDVSLLGQAARLPGGLLVFADDWGRHPSSCQHLVKQLLPQVPVTWVNTIGTRKPRLDLATARRAWGKMLGGRATRGGRESLAEKHLTDGKIIAAKDSRPLTTAPEPRVLNPLMWPYFTRGHDRWLNRKLLSRAITQALRGSENVTAITTLPITADLVGELPVAKWIYYCVDDFSQWPGLDGRTLDQMERELVAKVDVVVAASEVLRARMEAMRSPECRLSPLKPEAPARDRSTELTEALLSRSERRHSGDVQLLTHGVDFEHWRAPTKHNEETLFPDLPRPLIVFWGLIDRRLDFDWIEALSRQLDQGTILLVGPTQDPDPRLAQLPRVALRPAMKFDDLPALALGASVLIMPYADLPVTRAMQPLKLLEYLATGRPVVARRLPAVEEWGTALDAINSPDDFVSAVKSRLASGLPPDQLAARARLREHSWAAKAAQFLTYLSPER